KKVLVVLLVVATAVPQINALGTRRNTTTQRGSAARVKARVASPVARVNKATDTLGQILEQAEIVLEQARMAYPQARKMANKAKENAIRVAAKNEIHAAKNEIKRLMALLDEKVTDNISEDIDTINAISGTADSQ